jgi:hypothetical protein
MRRQHHVAVLAAFAVLHPDQHALAVDIGDLEGDYFGRAIDSKEAERLELKAKRDEAAKWNTQQMLASVMPNTSGRIIDWRRM